MKIRKIVAAVHSVLLGLGLVYVAFVVINGIPMSNNFWDPDLGWVRFVIAIFWASVVVGLPMGLSRLILWLWSRG